MYDYNAASFLLPWLNRSPMLTFSAVVVQIWAAFDSGAISRLWSKAITSAAILFATCPLMKGRTGSVLQVPTWITFNAQWCLKVQKSDFRVNEDRAYIWLGVYWLTSQAKSTLGRNHFLNFLCAMWRIWVSSVSQGFTVIKSGTDSRQWNLWEVLRSPGTCLCKAYFQLGLYKIKAWVWLIQCSFSS